MNGIKMSDCRFYVNEIERVVVCIVPNTKDMFYDFIYQHFRWKDFDTSFVTGWEDSPKLMMPSSFMGKAVCSASDEWNEELGKKIAFSRAKDKCYKSFFKRARYLVNMIDGHLGDMLEILNAFGEKLSNRRDELEEEIEKNVQK